MEQKERIKDQLEKYPSLKKITEYTLFVDQDELSNIKNSDEVYIETLMCDVSVEFLKKVLQDDVYFSYVKKYFKGDINNFRIASIFNGDTAGSIRYTKSQILKGLELLVESGDLHLTDSQKNKYQELKDIISFESFVSSVKGKNYDIDIEGKRYSISIRSMINLLLMTEDKFDRLCADNSIKYIDGILKEHFIYATLMYFRKSGVLNDFLLPDNIYYRYNDVYSLQKIDLQAINKYLETTDKMHDKIRLSEELRTKILEGMPDNYSKLEKAIYIYIKMCKILTYDDEYYAVNQKGVATEKHKDINYVSNITPLNNKVVCFEFNLIYSKLLSELGINFSSNYKGMMGEAYGESHANLTFRCDKFLVRADSVTSILKGDIMQAKLNQPLKGLNCANHNTNTYREFNELVSKVYELVATQEKKDNKDILVEHVQTFDEIMKEYENTTDNIKKVDLNEKLSILIDKVNFTKMVGIDSLSYVLQLKDVLFDATEKTQNIAITIIRNNEPFDKDSVAMASAIFTINLSDYSKQEDDNIYYYFNPNHELMLITKEELQAKFNDGTFEYVDIKNDPKIPGISERKGAVK
jgi:hypothetical protein